MKVCKVDNCPRKMLARGMCASHYRRWREGRPLGEVRRYGPTTCAFESCKNPHTSLGYCAEHYREIIGSDADYRRIRAYKMSPARYRALLRAQGGVCAVCGGDNGGHTLHVDHDHACCPGEMTCGQCVRGLLCFNCNGRLGTVEELGATHPQFEDYLTNPPARNVPEPEPPFARELELLRGLGLR